MAPEGKARTMSPIDFEQRIERLERIVEELRSSPRRKPGPDDWRTTVGAFSNDPRAKEILDEALQLREDERQSPSP
jgi:hypothetical protein